MSTPWARQLIIIKVFTRFCTEAQTLTLLYTIFAKKAPLLYTFYRQTGYPFHVPSLELSNPLKVLIKHKTRTFSRLFHSNKMHLIAVLGLFTIQVTDFLKLSYTSASQITTLSYTSTSEIPPLSYTWSLKKVPLGAEPPRIGHYR